MNFRRLLTIWSLLGGLILALPAYGGSECRGHNARASLVERAQNVLQNLVDAIQELIPRPQPSLARLRGAKIVAHRGAHDRRIGVRENTMEAFSRAERHGVWGIELDIHWSKDQVPFVLHDPSTGRVFGTDVLIARHTAEEIRRLVPEVPMLREVVTQFAPKMHLMIELKEPTDPWRAEILRSLLRDLRPVHDYHFLSLDLKLFEGFPHLPRRVFLPVAQTNTGLLSQAAREQDYAGVAGHYLLVSGWLLEMHRLQSQQVGVGFITSRNTLVREINRGVDWIFTDEAVKVQSLLNELTEIARRLENSP